MSARTLVVMCLAIVCAVLGPGCGRNQWLVELSTDARVPDVGDRLLVEVLDNDGNLACDDCKRDFDASKASLWPISFGVEPTSNKTRIRARLYRSRTTTTLPDHSDRMIDVVGTLPPLTSGLLGLSERAAMILPIQCFGHRPDIANHTSCREDETFHVGDGPEVDLKSFEPSVPFGNRGGCKNETPDGMACVGTGAFLLGDERYEASAFDYPASPETAQYVVLPLFMDLDEVTVGTVRKLIDKQIFVEAFPRPSLRLLARGAKGTVNEACTYLGQDNASNDALPITCIGSELAFQVCDALGKRLPFEVEWEFAAANGTTETIYPWGNPGGTSRGALNDSVGVTCKLSVLGRGRAELGEKTGCSETSWGPLPGGNPLDATALGIKNMAGNVAEWTEDSDFHFYTEPCFSDLFGGGLDCDDHSSDLSDAIRIPYRGGSWARSPDSAVVVGRYAEVDGAPSPYIGFRCATTDQEMLP